MIHEETIHSLPFAVATEPLFRATKSRHSRDPDDLIVTNLLALIRYLLTVSHTAVRLSIEQRQLVTLLALWNRVAGVHEGLINGHLLEQRDTQNLENCVETLREA